MNYWDYYFENSDIQLYFSSASLSALSLCEFQSRLHPLLKEGDSKMKFLNSRFKLFPDRLSIDREQTNKKINYSCVMRKIDTFHSLLELVFLNKTNTNIFISQISIFLYTFILTAFM